MTRLHILCFVALSVLSACATTPNIQDIIPNTQYAQRIEDIQAQEADLASKERGLNERLARFYIDAYFLDREARLVSNYPGWPEMLQIIKSYASIEHFEGKEQASQKTITALGK